MPKEKDPVDQAKYEVRDPEANGHRDYPPGLGDVFGIDDMGGGGRNQPVSQSFMTAHTNDMARQLAESRASIDFIYNMAHQEVVNQAALGNINMTVIVQLLLAGFVGVDGKAREEAVRVETGGMSKLQQMRGAFGRLLHPGGEPPPQLPQLPSGG